MYGKEWIEAQERSPIEVEAQALLNSIPSDLYREIRRIILIREEESKVAHDKRLDDLWRARVMRSGARAVSEMFGF